MEQLVQYFPGGGPIFLPKCPKKLHENEENWFGGGGV